MPKKRWPVYFFKSDTTGEKDFEEFFTETEELDLERFYNIGVIKNRISPQTDKLEHFETTIKRWIAAVHYDRKDIIALFNETVENFDHKDTGKFLDNRM